MDDFRSDAFATHRRSRRFRHSADRNKPAAQERRRNLVLVAHETLCSRYARSPSTPHPFAIPDFAGIIGLSLWFTLHPRMSRAHVALTRAANSVFGCSLGAAVVFAPFAQARRARSPRARFE